MEKVSIAVPYVEGDFEGELTDALISALSRTSQFRFAHSNGDWIRPIAGYISENFNSNGVVKRIGDIICICSLDDSL